MVVNASLAGKDIPPATGRFRPAMADPISPIPDDVLNTQLDLSSNLLSSSAVLEQVEGPVPPAPPVRTIEESLNLLANTCSDLVTNMSMLQRQIDVIDTEKEDRANQ